MSEILKFNTKQRSPEEFELIEFMASRLKQTFSDTNQLPIEDLVGAVIAILGSNDENKISRIIQIIEE